MVDECLSSGRVNIFAYNTAIHRERVAKYATVVGAAVSLAVVGTGSYIGDGHLFIQM